MAYGRMQIELDRDSSVVSAPARGLCGTRFESQHEK